MKGWLAVAAALGLAALLLWAQAAERRVGVASARIAALEADSARLARAAGRLDTVYRRDTLRFTRWRDSVVTLRDSLTLTDTVEVVQFIAVQDSTIASCTAALLTCEQRVALERDRTANAERRVVETRRLVGAPRTAAGISYDRTGWGVAVDRDLGRVRVGGSVTPGGGALRVTLWW